MPFTRTAAVAALALAATVTLGACGDDTEANTQAYCDAFATHMTNLQELKTLLASDTTTVAQLDEQADAVAESADDLQDAAEDLDQSVAQDVEQAGDDFERAVEGISGSTSLPEARTTVQAAADTFVADLQSIKSGVTCT